MSELKDIIKTKEELCTGCNRCVRECPMETVNITYLDKDGNIKVAIDTEKCIYCGRCITACKHDARYHVDDTERFFADLKKGVKISVIAAPSIKTNLVRYKQIFTYLKQLGVNMIYDVSLGADICIWAHVKYLNGQSGRTPMIAQPCPVIVTYCQIFNHELLKKLSPIQSPMACTSIYMKKYQGIDDRIAALTPCVAKAQEFETTKLADYNVTFEMLLKYLVDRKIEPPEDETEFDHDECGLGSLFPVPGGLKENLEYFTDNKLHITRAEGFTVYEKLNEYIQTPDDILPDIYDVVNCVDGCNLGTAYSHNKTIFEIDKTMYNTRRNALDGQKRAYYKSIYEEYDKTFDLPDFFREYELIHVDFPQITDDDITKAYKSLGKTVFNAQHIDCSACGSNTCYDMSRKIALGVNIPENCIVKSKEDAKYEHDSYVSAQEQILEMEMIRESDKRLLEIINANPQISVLFNSSFNVIDCNPAALTFFGYSEKSEVLKKNGFAKRIEDILPEFQPDGRLFSLTGRLKEAVENGYTRFEAQFIVNNSERTLDIEFKRIPYENNFAIVTYAHDMTDLHMRESELVRLRIAAEAASTAKSAFLSTMSHEIRTPLNAIVGMAAIAETADDAGRKDYAISKIKNASTHVLGVINDILDMSKIEADKFELSHISFEFEKLLKKIIDFIDFQMVERQQRFFINIDENIPHVLIGDEQRLSQVITNLLSNSVKFTPEKGTIRLDAELISENNGVCCLQITVADTGIGISKEHLTRLFDSYEQAQSDTARIYGGTGLGLSISKHLVGLMGGDIRVESELEKGTKFIFTVTLKRDDNEYTELPSSGIGGKINDYISANLPDTQTDVNEITDDFSGYTALLVEDIAINREVVIALLEPTKITIVSAEDGIQALNLITEEPSKYDIIFMDIQMPEIDGYEVTRRIREMNDIHTNAVPIVAMTANVFREDIEKCFQSGMNGHLGKPLSYDSIVSQMRIFLQGKRQVSKENRRKEDRRKKTERRQSADRRQTKDRRGTQDDIEDHR
jgi:PAS domain S-box-containing protein